MNVVYNSTLYSVLAYPAQHGFELVDKAARRSMFLHGPSAMSFSQAIENIPDEDRTEEAIDDLLGEYCEQGARPIVIH